MFPALRSFEGLAFCDLEISIMMMRYLMYCGRLPEVANPLYRSFNDLYGYSVSYHGLGDIDLPCNYEDDLYHQERHDKTSEHTDIEILGYCAQVAADIACWECAPLELRQIAAKATQHAIEMQAWVARCQVFFSIAQRCQ